MDQHIIHDDMWGVRILVELTVLKLGLLYSAIPFLPLFQLCKVCVTALVIFHKALIILLLTKIKEILSAMNFDS